MTWAPSSDLICSVAHIVCGYAFTITGAYFRKVKTALLLLLAWAIFKEFIFDIWVEDQTIHGGWCDASAYLIGAILALAIIYIKNNPKE
jgi:hypothetical protein